MSQPFDFMIKTIKGGVFFVIPLTVILTVLAKAHAFLKEFTAPLASILPKNILGIDGSFIIAFVILISACFLGGLLIQYGFVRKRIDFLEMNLLSRLPGYSFLKSAATDNPGDGNGSMQAVMIPEDETYLLGLVIEKHENLCTVFIPSAPNFTSGEIKICDINTLLPINAKAKDVLQMFSRHGRGSNQWLMDVHERNKNRGS